MAQPPDAARAHDASKQLVVAGIARRAAGLWEKLDPTALDESWARGRVGEQMFVTVSAGQQIAASLADKYVDEVLTEQGIDAARTASIRSAAFAGIASDGRAL